MAELHNIQTLITQHIDLWTGAVKDKSSAGRGGSSKRELYGIKKLRELILELAVRGKLVAQDPNDEPASVLLERIAAEKAELVKQGKIKKPKKLPEISEEEKPFELPQGWEWVFLGDIGSIVGGGTPKSGESAYWCDKGVKWLTPADLYGLNEKYIGSGKRDITQLGLEKSSAQLLPAGSVLFSSRAPIGYVAIASNTLSTNQGFKSVVPYMNELSDFIYYFLKRSAKLIDAEASGTTFKEVSGAVVNKVAMPLPPIREQHRIVNKVDELMALCDQLEQQTESSLDAHQTLVQTLLDTLLRSADAEELEQNWQRLSAHFDLLFTTEQSIDQLKQTILQLAVMGKLVPQDPNDEPASELLKRIADEKEELVKQKKIKKQKPLPPISDDEKPFQLPKGWEWCRLGAVGNSTESSIVDGPFGSSINTKRDYIDSGVPVVRMSNISPFHFKNTELKFVSKEKFSELKRHNILPGDVLFGKVGSIGNAVIYPSDSTEALIATTGVARFRVGQVVTSEYLCILLNALGDHFRSMASQAVQPFLNMKTINGQAIALPPLSQQDIIVLKVDQLMALCDQLKAKLADSKTTQLNLTDALVAQAV
jgi:type I restriction enzyme S subunit